MDGGRVFNFKIVTLINEKDNDAKRRYEKSVSSVF